MPAAVAKISSPRGRSPTRSSSIENKNQKQEQKQTGKRPSLVQVGSAGRVSPSAVCRQRALSAAIVTPSAAEDAHEYVMGRPKVVLPIQRLEQYSVKITGTSSTDTAASTPSDDSSERSNPSGRPPHPNNNHRAGTAATPERPLSHRRQISASASSENNISRVLSDPPPLRLDAWAEAAGASYKIRGQNYLCDKKKWYSAPSVFTLMTVDLIRTSGGPILSGMCSHPEERIQKALAREAKTGIKELPDFVFCVNLSIPGPPDYHLVMYFAVGDINDIRTDKTAFGRVAKPFFFGSSNEYRDETFKLIPCIVDGNFVVRKAVGSKPTLLGTKLKHHYIQNERFLELVCDIGSNSVAQKIVKLSTGVVSVLFMFCCLRASLLSMGDAL